MLKVNVNVKVQVQVQSVLLGELSPLDALLDINQTVDCATLVANQTLALAKVKQLHQRPELKRRDLADVMRAIALDPSALVTDKNIDFLIFTASAPMAAH